MRNSLAMRRCFQPIWVGEAAAALSCSALVLVLVLVHVLFLLCVESTFEILKLIVQSCER